MYLTTPGYPTRCTIDDDRATCRRAVALARRTQHVVQHGELMRLVSPVEGNDRSRAALAYRSSDGSHAVVFAYQLEPSTVPPPRLEIGHLAAGRDYHVTTTGLEADEPSRLGVMKGEVLSGRGLDCQPAEPCTARIWEIDGRQ